MALEIYKDDAMINPLKQAEKFIGPGNAYTLASLTIAEVGSVYKYDGASYIKLLLTTDYSLVGSSIQLVTYLTVDEHIIVMPVDDMDMLFTGPEAAVRTQTSKVIFHKYGAFVYDDLKLYSEDFLVTPYEGVETIVNDGFQTCSLNGLGLYDKNGIEMTDSNAIGIQVASAAFTPDVTYGYTTVVVVINNTYVGKLLANNTTVLALPLSTVIPTPTNVTDTIEVLSTGSLTFAIDTNGTMPVDEAFKPLLVIPTLTTAAPMQKVWLRAVATIQATTAELPNMPFKLSGQEYAE